MVYLPDTKLKITPQMSNVTKNAILPESMHSLPVYWVNQSLHKNFWRLVVTVARWIICGLLN